MGSAAAPDWRPDDADPKWLDVGSRRLAYATYGDPTGPVSATPRPRSNGSTATTWGRSVWPRAPR